MVFDTSVLAAFSGVKKLAWLRVLFEGIYIPSAVFRELVVDGAGWVEVSEVQEALRNSGWIQVVDLAVAGIAVIPGLKIDEGEREVLSLARAWGCMAVLDEKRARVVAGELGVPVIGTLGILKLAKGREIIGKIAPILAAMRLNGLRFSDPLLEKFLRSEGERWPP